MGVNKEIEGNPKVFDYADMHLKCHSCGEDVVIFDNVKGGLRVDLYTTDQHKLVLACDKCGAKMEMYYTEAANPPAEAVEAQEAMKEVADAIEKAKENDTDEEVQSETSEDDEVKKEAVKELVDEIMEDLEKIDAKLEEEEPQDEQIPEEVKAEE